MSSPVGLWRILRGVKPGVGLRRVWGGEVTSGGWCAPPEPDRLKCGVCHSFSACEHS